MGGEEEKRKRKRLHKRMKARERDNGREGIEREKLMEGDRVIERQRQR